MRLKVSRPNILIHIVAWIPLAVLIWDFSTDHLTVNPIQAATQRTGKIAIAFLMLSLACTPFNTLTGVRQVLPLRRPLGLYAFFYALLHFTIFTGVDYGFDWELLKGAIFEKPYALLGLSALILLLPLALTSWRWWMKKLGKGWKQLHQLVYPAGVLVVIHYAWVVKGDLLALRGDILRPLLYGLLLVFMFGLRIPLVRRRVVQLRRNLQNRHIQPPPTIRQGKKIEPPLEQ